MPLTRIKTDFGQLDQIAATFRREAALTKKALASLRTQTGILADGDWVGSAATKFYAEMNERVFPAFARLITALEQSAQTTCRIGEIMRQADTDSARQFRLDATGAAPAIGAMDMSGLASVLRMGVDGMLSGNRAGALAVPVRASNVDLGIALKEKVLKSERVDGELFVDDEGNVTQSDNAINPNDIYQGGLGDCYLLASLAAVARQKPSLIRNMVKANRDGSYTVTFKKEIYGKYIDVPVTVQPDFLVDGNGLRATRAEVGDQALNGKPEIWVPIIEKAYAQLNGGYSNISGGFDSDVVPMLTGTRSERHKPSELAFEEFQEKFKAGSAVTLETLPKGAIGTANVPGSLYENGTLATGHDYAVVGVNKSTQTVMLQNPWGWSDIPITVPYSQLQVSLQSININNGTQPS